MAAIKNITNGQFDLDIDLEDRVNENLKFIRVPGGDIYDTVRRKDPNTHTNYYIESIIFLTCRSAHGLLLPDIVEISDIITGVKIAWDIVHNQLLRDWNADAEIISRNHVEQVDIIFPGYLRRDGPAVHDHP